MSFDTRQQLWKDIYGNAIGKEAELSGTYDMPQTKPSSKCEDKKTVVKTASSEDEMLKQAFEHHVDNVSVLHPHVDVQGLEPPRTIVKSASRYALPLDEKYPLDGYDQVKMASTYFEEHQNEMPVEVRRVYCQNMVKRADELGIRMSETAQKYASSRFANSTEIDIALAARQNCISKEDHRQILQKVAEARSHLFPEQFAELLLQFDKMANIDSLYGREIPDPYLSTFGKEASPQESKTDPQAALLIGNEYVTLRKFIEFSKLRQAAVKARFGEAFALEFTKDPKGIYDSLPRDQKLILIRMANNNESAREGASTS